ncbi:MAG: hypothetical protein AABZ14_04605, partial [Candidatus Margulisiibacteriota bacterium]
RVIWRINVNTLHFSLILWQECFEREQVVTLNDDVLGIVLALERLFRILFERVIRNGEMMIPDSGSSFEVEGSHIILLLVSLMNFSNSAFVMR